MLNQWLSNALQISGVSQSELSRRLTEALGRSIDRAAVNKMTNGKRNISADELIEIERITGVAGPDREQSPPTVPLIGLVGVGSNIAIREPFDEVPAPEGATKNTVGIRIETESVGQILKGWIAFYENVKQKPSPELLNKLCVVWLFDGPVLLKKLSEGSKAGYFKLESQFDPPIYDAPVEFASPVDVLRPR